jgi:dephospho-CoA kinase
VFTVALTGGIASGKSSVATYFSELGITIIDADQIARKLICHASVLGKILDYFGPSVLTSKQLDRAKLRDVIFSNTTARDWLEQLLHPLIYREIRAAVQVVESAYVIIVIPLLFEARTAVLLNKKPNSDHVIALDRILLVTTSKDLQTQRLQERDHLQQKQIAAILASQILPEEALYKADDIIYNARSLADLLQAVKRFHQLYLSLSQTKNIVLEKSLFLRYYLALK